MNCLYLGPFRYNNLFGICSRNIIESLDKTKDITLYTKHILLNNIYSNQTMVNCASRGNRLFPEKFDVVIEHCPVDMMCIDHNIADKYIAIPIMDYGISSDTKLMLNDFDDILIDNEHHKKILKHLDIESTVIDYDIAKNTDIKSRINIGINNFKTKMYFIGSYEQNINIINKLIVSFTLAFRNNDSVALILVLNDDNKEHVLKAIEKTISEIYSKLSFYPKISPIQTIAQKLSEEETHLVHNTFDIFIDLTDEYDTGLNCYIAKLYNNTILSINDVESVIVPYLDGYVNDTRHKYSVLTTSLSEKLNQKLTEHIHGNRTQTINNKTISEIL